MNKRQHSNWNKIIWRKFLVQSIKKISSSSSLVSWPPAKMCKSLTFYRVGKGNELAVKCEWAPTDKMWASGHHDMWGHVIQRQNKIWRRNYFCIGNVLRLVEMRTERHSVELHKLHSLVAAFAKIVRAECCHSPRWDYWTQWKSRHRNLINKKWIFDIQDFWFHFSLLPFLVPFRPLLVLCLSKHLGLLRWEGGGDWASTPLLY